MPPVTASTAAPPTTAAPSLAYRPILPLLSFALVSLCSIAAESCSHMLAPAMYASILQPCTHPSCSHARIHLCNGWAWCSNQESFQHPCDNADPHSRVTLRLMFPKAQKQKVMILTLVMWLLKVESQILVHRAANVVQKRRMARWGPILLCDQSMGDGTTCDSGWPLTTTVCICM